MVYSETLSLLLAASVLLSFPAHPVSHCSSPGTFEFLCLRGKPSGPRSGRSCSTRPNLDRIFSSGERFSTRRTTISRDNGSRHSSVDFITQARRVVGLRGGLGDGGEVAGLLPYSLVDCQRAGIDEVMSRARNYYDDGDGSGGPWRAVVYDAHWRDVLSMAIRPSDLSLHGAIVHYPFVGERLPIMKLPGVVFLRPSLQSMSALAEHISSPDCNLTSLHIYTSGLSNKKQWAPLLALGGEFWEERVASACDVCLDYIALEPRLFTLGISDAYRALHHVSQERSNQTGRGKVRGGAERDLEVLSRVVEGLYNVLSTCHLRPIIRAQRGLRPALTFNMPNRDGLLQFADPHAFSPSDGTTITQARPLLVIADRTIDLPVMLHHASDYQSLALDCLNLRMNRVTLYEDEDTREEDGGSTKSTSAHETVTSVSIRHRSSCCGAQFGAIAM